MGQSSCWARNMDRLGFRSVIDHAHVLICLAEQPDARLRDLAERVGITERAVKLRQPVEAHSTIQDLLTMVRKKRG